MVERYRTETVARVQGFLETEPTQCQIMKIRRAKDITYDEVRSLPEFPDEHVSNGTRVYQRWYDGQIFEICILKGM